MEVNKIKVGITQGDINGVGYEVILKTFSDPAMLAETRPSEGSLRPANIVDAGKDDDDLEMEIES